jgi:hypothetical protein
MRAKRIVVFNLIAVLLFLTSVEVLAHNHPLFQGENNSCPAYILYNTANLEQSTPPIEPFNPVPFVEILHLQNDSFQPLLIFTCFSHRAPPPVR